jgi:hypothetical protein
MSSAKRHGEILEGSFISLGCQCARSDGDGVGIRLCGWNKSK